MRGQQTLAAVVVVDWEPQSSTLVPVVPALCASEEVQIKCGHDPPDGRARKEAI